MLNSYGRPPLVPHLQVRALELNQRALKLLAAGAGVSDVAWSRAVFVVLTAGAACWEMFRPLLAGERRESVKRNLSRQHRLLRPLRAMEAGVIVSSQAALQDLRAHTGKTDERRCLAWLVEQMGRETLTGLSRQQSRELERLLTEQSRWLGELAAAPVADEAQIRPGLVRVYRRARIAVKHDPASGRARRRLSCLVWMHELIREASDALTTSTIPRTDSGRLWLGLEEDRWLRTLPATRPARELARRDCERLERLVRQRRGQLARSNRTLVQMALGESSRSFAARLPWMIFQGLAPAPDGG